MTANWKTLIGFGAAFVLAADGADLHANEATYGNPSISAEWMTELKSKLTDMGLTLNADATAKAATLAVVQTIDAKARLIQPEEWSAIEKQREGWFYLPGFRLGITNGLPVIREIFTESAAETAGLKTGDVIVGVNTHRFERIALPDIQRMLRANQEATHQLVITRNGETNRVGLTFTRRTQPAIEAAELLPNQIGYIKVNGLYPGAGRDVVSQIRAWSETGREGIILDLRGAGGADDAAITQVASLYAAGGQFLFAYRDHHHQDIEVFKASEGKPVDVPLMVLIDRDTSGAAETLAAVLNNTARPALLIGEATAGDFNLRQAVEISGHWVFMAAKVIDTADGWRYNGQFGVQPSVALVERERDTHDYEPPVNLLDRRKRLEIEEHDAAMRRRVRGDGALERALDILIGLKALNKGTGGLSSPEA